MKNKKIIGISALIAVFLSSILLVGSLFYLDYKKYELSTYTLLGDNELGTVERLVYGNLNAKNSIAIITGMHPRETLAINPVIEAAKKFPNKYNNVKIIHYQVNVTKNPKDYKKGRNNGESLVHDFVNPDVTKSDAKCVIISHSHIEGYGEGFYLATPYMDEISVRIATEINNTSEFNYYPNTGNESYKSTSAKLVSKPIAQEGYPTFVYEIPENITKAESFKKTEELFYLMLMNAC